MGFKLLLIIVVVITGVLLFVSYKESTALKAQGDLLLQQNKPQEALLYYEEEKNVFPLRQDVNDDINSIGLLMNSQTEYSQIVDQEYAESQTIPFLQTIAPVELKVGEFFVPILI